jgi:uncharacterized membrane protein YfcA
MTPIDWLTLALAAIVVGVSKTSIGGLGTVAVALFALVLPAKESTAAVLLLLIVGDIVAVSLYRRQADWDQLRRLLPAVVPGIIVGAIFLGLVSDRVLLVSIGLLVLIAVGLQLTLRWHQTKRVAAVRRPEGPTGQTAASGAPEVAAPALAATGGAAAERPAPPVNRWAAVAAGLAAGFTTMVANAAGAVMSLYLLAIKADKVRFVATGAWFFLLVNVSKVPFSVGLGLIHLRTLGSLATLIPVVLLGTWLGGRFLRSLSQHSFEGLTILASAASGLVLVIKGLA